MTEKQHEYLIANEFIDYGGDFKLSMFFNLCYKEDFLYYYDYKDDEGEVDITKLQSGMENKENFTIKGLKLYNPDLKVMYKNFIKTEKALLTV